MVHKLPAMVKAAPESLQPSFHSGRLLRLQRFSDRLAEAEVLGERPEAIRGERPYQLNCSPESAPDLFSNAWLPLTHLVLQCSELVWQTSQALKHVRMMLKRDWQRWRLQLKAQVSPACCLQSWCLKGQCTSYIPLYREQFSS